MLPKITANSDRTSAETYLLCSTDLGPISRSITRVDLGSTRPEMRQALECANRSLRDSLLGFSFANSPEVPLTAGET